MPPPLVVMTASITDVACRVLELFTALSVEGFAQYMYKDQQKSSVKAFKLCIGSAAIRVSGADLQSALKFRFSGIWACVPVTQLVQCTAASHSQQPRGLCGQGPRTTCRLSGEEAVLGQAPGFGGKVHEPPNRRLDVLRRNGGCVHLVSGQGHEGSASNRTSLPRRSHCRRSQIQSWKQTLAQCFAVAGHRRQSPGCL